MAQHLGPGHTVVTILCDSGNSYRSKVKDSHVTSHDHQHRVIVWHDEVDITSTHLQIFNEEFQREKGITVERRDLKEFTSAFDPLLFTNHWSR